MVMGEFTPVTLPSIAPVGSINVNSNSEDSKLKVLSENKRELCGSQMKHKEMVIVIEHGVEVEGKQPYTKLKRAVNLVHVSCKMMAAYLGGTNEMEYLPGYTSEKSG